MTGLYRIADTGVRITTIHDLTHRLCAAYRTQDSPVDLSVEITPEDILFERMRAAESESFEGVSHRAFADDYFELLSVYRKISEALPFRDTFLMHGSCIAVDGEAFLFTAKSGTGKSTHTRLWRQLFGDRAVMVNDDKPLIRAAKNGAIAYGTPWDGKHRLSTNIAVPLRAVCILERAEKNSIRRITAGEEYPMLLQQIYRPLDPDAMKKTVELIDRLTASVDLWKLGCNMDPEAAEVASAAMKG